MPHAIFNFVVVFVPPILEQAPATAIKLLGLERSSENAPLLLKGVSSPFPLILLETRKRFAAAFLSVLPRVCLLFRVSLKFSLIF